MSAFALPSGGQIQIMIWFKSRLNHVQWFDLKNNDLIYKTCDLFYLIWNFMIWFTVIQITKIFDGMHNAIVSDEPHSVVMMMMMKDELPLAWR